MGTINLPVRHMHSHSFAQWIDRYHWIDYHIKQMKNKLRVVIYLLQTGMVRDHPEYHNLNKTSQTLAAKQHQKSKQHLKKEESKITHLHSPAAADHMTNYSHFKLTGVQVICGFNNCIFFSQRKGTVYILGYCPNLTFDVLWIIFLWI